MIFVGIDCGLHGAVAWLREDGRSGAAWDMPITDGELDYARMGTMMELLLAKDPRLAVAIEEIAPLPNVVKDGVRGFGRGSIAAVKLGAHYGAWRREIARLGVTPTVVAPSVWKRIMLGNYPKAHGEQKKAAVAMAMQLFPWAGHLFTGPRGGLRDGRAEAMLLAELARRTWRLAHG